MLLQAGMPFGVRKRSTSIPPLDGVTAPLVAFGLNRLRTAYVGQAVNVRRSSDNATQDIGFSGNDFDTAAFSSFVGGGTGFVVTAYDQSGNGNDATQGTAAKQPSVVLNAQNGKPVIAATADTQFLETASKNIATALLGLIVGKCTSHAFSAFLTNSAANSGNAWATSGFVFGPQNTFADYVANDILMYGNGYTAGRAPRAIATTPSYSTDGLFHIIEGSLSASVASILQDGTAATMRVSTAGAVPSMTAPISVFGSNDLSCSSVVGQYGPIMLFSGALPSAGNMSTIRARLGAYFGIAVT